MKLTDIKRRLLTDVIAYLFLDLELFIVKMPTIYRLRYIITKSNTSPYSLKVFFLPIIQFMFFTEKSEEIIKI